MAASLPTTARSRPSLPSDRERVSRSAAGPLIGSPTSTRRPAGPLVVDARDGDRFRGETEPVDPRAGHIPGARSLPTRGHLGADSRFLPVHEIRERFAAVGVDSPTDELIAYCGSGVTASHTLLTLEHAGLGRGRLYSGSWSQYSATDRPAATGPE